MGFAVPLAIEGIVIIEMKGFGVRIRTDHAGKLFRLSSFDIDAKLG